MSTSPAEYHFADWKVKVNSPNTVAVLAFMAQYSIPEIHVVEIVRGVWDGGIPTAYRPVESTLSRKDDTDEITYSRTHRGFPAFQIEKEALSFAKTYCLMGNFVFKTIDQNLSDAIHHHLMDKNQIGETKITDEMRQWLNDLCAFYAL